MKQTSLNSQLRDQRGVAMLFELVLVVAVLSVVGLAVYQSNQPSKTAATPTAQVSPASAVNLAASAAAVAEADVAADAALSADADAAAAELSEADADADAASLGDTANASF